MRHRKKTLKLGRKSEHRDALLSNLSISLITHGRITTTISKAKALRPFAEKLVTLGKKGDLHHRRLAASKLNNKDAVRKLFADIAPAFKERAGGYTRIYKLGPRQSDASEMALIEWVEADATSVSDTTPTKADAKEETEAPAKKSTKKAAKDVVDVEAEKVE